MGTILAVPISLPAGEHTIEIVNENGYVLRLVDGAEVLPPESVVIISVLPNPVTVGSSLVVRVASVGDVTTTTSTSTTAEPTTTTTLPPEVIIGFGVRVSAGVPNGAFRINFGGQIVKVGVRQIANGAVRVMTASGPRELV